MNLIQTLEQEEIARLNKTIPEFAPGDTVIVIGDFRTTSLNYSTITVEGSNANDTVDISGLTSEHRIVFDSHGGTDNFIGGVRPQDVVTGIPGLTASGLSVGGGIESDFELMELIQDNTGSFARAVIDDTTMRSGLSGGSTTSVYVPMDLFDHTKGFLDRIDPMDAGVRQMITDYSLV